MKQQRNYITFSLALLLAFLAAACTREAIGQPSPERPDKPLGSGVVFTLDVQDGPSWTDKDDAKTRQETAAAVTTTDAADALHLTMTTSWWSTPESRSVATDKEKTINNVFLLQYDAVTGNLLYYQADTLNSNKKLVTDKLQPNTDFNLYLLANYGENPFDKLDPIDGTIVVPDTEAKFKATQSGTDLGATPLEADSLPMYGELLNQSTDWLSAVTIPMKRLVCRVIYDFKDDYPGWTPTQCRLMNAPKRVRWYPDATIQPGTAGIRPTNTLASDFTTYTLNAVRDTFYILENMRGENSAATTSSNKKYEGVYATHLDMNGTTDGTTDPSGKIYELSGFRFYLGKDLTTDFNVERNTSYTVAATLKGYNPKDLRCRHYGLRLGKFAGWDPVNMKFTKDLFLDRRGDNATGNNDGTGSDPIKPWHTANINSGLRNVYNGWNNTYYSGVTAAYSAMWYCRGKNGVATEKPSINEGWYMPSLSEAMIFWVIAPAIDGYAAGDGTVIPDGGKHGFFAGNYWASTETAFHVTAAYGVTHLNTPTYAVLYNDKASYITRVRCVKAY